jgi:hypothetical protein
MSSTPTLELHYQPSEHSEMAKQALARMTCADVFGTYDEIDKKNPAKDVLADIPAAQFLKVAPVEHWEKILEQLARRVEWEVFCDCGDADKFCPITDRPKYNELESKHRCQLAAFVRYECYPDY